LQRGPSLARFRDIAALLPALAEQLLNPFRLQFETANLPWQQV
jgi:hypothetical protein